MLFEVKDNGYKPSSLYKNIAYLIVDNWNDWWEFRTMYTLVYIDDYGSLHHIGSVKIGEFSMQKGQARPDLPISFEQLDERFFSLGQDDYYYENLNKISGQIREEFLQALNDIAFNEELFGKAIYENVTKQSLLRDISSTTVRKQFNRIANGGARLTKYEFTYMAPREFNTQLDPMTFLFEVIPESNPPTNIHVLIGRNGVGKTRLIKNMIAAITNGKDDSTNIGFFSADEPANNLFANIICIAFSAFDEFPHNNPSHEIIPYVHIGLPRSNNQLLGGLDQLTKEFVDSLKFCLSGAKRKLLENAITILESDPIFNESGVKELTEFKYDAVQRPESKFVSKANSIFKRLSSGHKIIILTLTKLVETVEEKSLVFLDEPEGHLHPPLLSAFIRALSDLLVNRNGVAIIATHSPVILQEVPKSCVWKLRRAGIQAIAERLDIESFGENISALTSEVFGLEVTYSGFHKLLNDAVDKYDSYDGILSHFNYELGMEARAIVKALLAAKTQED
ncbi:AAA family ATPase [Sporomusa aerivorans]|uniref:AAA family ATPase n=1 Tax=Sporomusa aerivorans TaxID=204936 RepID=UPI00352A81B2